MEVIVAALGTGLEPAVLACERVCMADKGRWAAVLECQSIYNKKKGVGMLQVSNKINYIGTYKTTENIKMRHQPIQLQLRVKSA